MALQQNEYIEKQRSFECWIPRLAENPSFCLTPLLLRSCFCCSLRHRYLDTLFFTPLKFIIRHLPELTGSHPLLLVRHVKINYHGHHGNFDAFRVDSVPDKINGLPSCYYQRNVTMGGKAVFVFLLKNSQKLTEYFVGCAMRREEEFLLLCYVKKLLLSLFFFAFLSIFFFRNFCLIIFHPLYID